MTAVRLCEAALEQIGYRWTKVIPPKGSIVYLAVFLICSANLAEKTVSLIPLVRPLWSLFYLCMGTTQNRPTNVEDIIRLPMTLFKLVVKVTVWALAFIFSPIMTSKAFQKPLTVRAYNDYLEEGRQFIKSLLKIAILILIAKALRSATLRGGPFYAIPLAAFCLNPQITCEAGSFLLASYANKNWKQSYNKARSLLIHMAERKAKMPEGEYRKLADTFKHEVIAMRPFFRRSIGGFVIYPLSILSGIALRHLTSLYTPWKNVQDLTQQYILEWPADKIATSMAPAITWAFGYQ